MRLSVAGLGKLGACSAACFAYKGFEVIGVDIDRECVDAVNRGKAPVVEPRLEELIRDCEGRLTATQDYGKALMNSDATFLIVPTPSRPDGHFSDRYLQDALRHLAAAFRRKDGYHLFVVTSTVSPGTTEEILIPLIQSISGKELGKDFGVCYNPEFIALGTAINDFLNPDLVLIGESDRTAGERLEGIYSGTVENRPYVASMSIVSAEIAKISLNSYITMKISFANTLANICESIPNADIDDITRALGGDRRISPYYLKGGVSYGGPCFPRDNKAFAAFAEKYGVEATLAKATDEVNEYQIKHQAALVKEHIKAGNDSAVSILGLAYKPNTPVIEESPAVKLIEELLKEDLNIIVYDPLAMDNVRAHFADNVLYAASVEDCLGHSSLCVIMAPHEEFKSIHEGCIVHDPTTIIDCWRILDGSRLGGKVRYVPYGKRA